MITDPIKLAEVLEEISEWNLDDRRWYIASIEQAFDKASAEQIKSGLIELWKRKA